MNRLRKSVWASLVISALTAACDAQVFKQACPNPKFPSPTQTVADTSCPVAGNGRNETSQNVAKNNFCAPAPFPQKSPVLPISFQTLMKLQDSVAQDGSINLGDPGSPNPGPTQNRTRLRQIVNCGKNVPNAAVRHDVHVSLFHYNTVALVLLTTNSNQSAAKQEAGDAELESQHARPRGCSGQLGKRRKQETNNDEHEEDGRLQTATVKFKFN
jgi:hypothetical protein